MEMERGTKEAQDMRISCKIRGVVMSGNIDNENIFFKNALKPLSSSA
jgi:hypothetical protein